MISNQPILRIQTPCRSRYAITYSHSGTSPIFAITHGPVSTLEQHYSILRNRPPPLLLDAEKPENPFGALSGGSIVT